MRWEGPQALSPGKHTLEFDFKYDSLGFATFAFNSVRGIGRSGTGELKVDGKVVSTQKMEHTIPIILQFDETFDVGADTGTPVDDNDYQVPFHFTGRLAKLTLRVDQPKLARQTKSCSCKRGSATNWLKAVPGKGYRVILRLYDPNEAFLEQALAAESCDRRRRGRFELHGHRGSAGASCVTKCHNTQRCVCQFIRWRAEQGRLPLLDIF